MSDPQPKRPGNWMTFERALTVASLLVAAGSFVTSINSLEKRVTAVESRQDMLRDTLAEMKGDVKLMMKSLERLERERLSDKPRGGE